MCASCVAQGVTYVGGAVAGLQVMAVRARRRRGRSPVTDQPAHSSVASDQVDLAPLTPATGRGAD